MDITSRELIQITTSMTVNLLMSNRLIRVTPLTHALCMSSRRACVKAMTAAAPLTTRSMTSFFGASCRHTLTSVPPTIAT